MATCLGAQLGLAARQRREFLLQRSPLGADRSDLARNLCFDPFVDLPRQLGEFRFDLRRTRGGFLARRECHGNPALRKTLAAPVIEEERVDQRGRVGDENAVGDQGIVWHRDRHVRSRRQQPAGLGERVAGDGRRDAATARVDRLSVRAEHDRGRAHAADAHPRRVAHHRVHAPLDLIGDGPCRGIDACRDRHLSGGSSERSAARRP